MIESFDEFMTELAPRLVSVIFLPTQEDLDEHAQARQGSYCNPSEYGCGVVMAIREAFDGRFPSMA